MKWIAIMLAAVPSVAHAADQFDLVCVGTQEMTNLSTLSIDKSEDRRTYRVDLKARKYCEAECGYIRDIHSFADDHITFIEKNAEGNPLLEKSLEQVNREDGSYYVGYFPRRGELGMLVSKGTCEPKPFSGFPKVDQKF